MTYVLPLMCYCGDGTPHLFSHHQGSQMTIKIGDTVTAVTPSGVLIQGQVIDKYDTDAEGRPLTGGASLVVSARDHHGQDREHVVKLKDIADV